MSEIRGTWVLPVDWDVMKKNYKSGFRGSSQKKYKIINQTIASVAFGLFAPDDGSSLGEVRIRKLKTGWIEIDVTGVPLGAESLPDWPEISKNLNGKPREVIRAALLDRDARLKKRREELMNMQGVAAIGCLDKIRIKILVPDN